MEHHYWINTVSLNHVERGVAGGFTQANHGNPQGLKRLKRGDGLVFYSPKLAYPVGEPLQAFTAIGTITDDAPYQATMTPEFHPFRRSMTFEPCEQVPIRPLIAQLSFIKDPERWGFIFRRGLFEIPQADFELIESFMLNRT